MICMSQFRVPVLHVGQGTHLGALSVFPVWADGPAVRGLDTGRAAQVVVAEREPAPVVDEVVVTNRGHRPVLLLAGELFEGGWQHRALNHDMVLAAKAQMVASVSCVEHGRWHGGAEQVRRARRASVLVRSAQAMSPVGQRQQQVWERVSRYDDAFGGSATASYVEHLDRSGAPAGTSGTDQSAALLSQVSSVRALAGQRGVLIGLGGQPAFLELFCSPSALRAHLTALLEAAVLDAALVPTALLPAAPTPGRRARRLVERVGTAALTVDAATDTATDAATGAGRCLSFGSEHYEVRGLGWDDRLVHATIFNRRHPLLEVA